MRRGNMNAYALRVAVVAALLVFSSTCLASRGGTEDSATPGLVLAGARAAKPGPVERITIRIGRAWDRFWCSLLGGCPPSDASVMDELLGAKEADEEVDEEAGDRALNEFCDLNVTAPSLLDCGCCGDHMNGDPAALSSMLYGGALVVEEAFSVGEDMVESPAGKIRMWSFGRRVPRILCRKRRPVCICEDFKTHKDGSFELLWRESQDACRAGRECDHTKEIPLEGASSAAKDAKLKVRDPTLPRIPNCAGNPPTRIPLGRAKCEDASPEQCADLFSLGLDGVWKSCEIDHAAPRKCAARLNTEDAAQRAADEAAEYAAKEVFNPGLGWAKHVDHGGDNLVHVDGSPTLTSMQLRQLVYGDEVIQS